MNGERPHGTIQAASLPAAQSSVWFRLIAGVAAGLLIVDLVWEPSRLGSDNHMWAAVAVVALAALLPLVIPTAQRLLPTPGIVPLTIVAAVAAIYACVPETNTQMGVVAAVAAVGVVVEPVLRRPLPGWWHTEVSLLVLWSGIFGATGRQSALIGALFALWPVVIVPLAVVLLPQLGLATERIRWLLAAVGAVSAVAVARTGGIADSARPAIIAVAVAIVVTVGIAVLLAHQVSGTVRNRAEQSQE